MKYLDASSISGFDGVDKSKKLYIVTVSSHEIRLECLFLGRRKAALYCFYFHWKCPERPERCQYIYYIYIYIYICQQHGGREVGTKSFGYISVKFIRLLLILSAKGLLDQKSSSKYYFSQ